jgi:hypothetical protein
MKEQLITSTDHVEANEIEDPFLEWYTSTLTDYIYKMTIASVLFFISYPWAALFWLPYYFTDRRKE